jgi:hypothetical protein
VWTQGHHRRKVRCGQLGTLSAGQKCDPRDSAGVADLAWMAPLAMIMLAEKTLPSGESLP